MTIKSIIKKIIPEFLINFYHLLLSLAGAIIYGFPSSRMKVIGITGTSGKTTVTMITANILSRAGYKVAALSSVEMRINEKREENKLKMTMPGRTKIQKFLSQARRAGCQYVILEVTSEGIKQNRHRFINFQTALLTNLSPEHIESHKGFENYKKAKAKLFKSAKKVHIINVNDENAPYFSSFQAEEKYGFGIEGKKEEVDVGKFNKIIRVKNINLRENATSFEVEGIVFRTSLLGEFNVYNALAAISIAVSEGISLEVCRESLEKEKGVPGRMEIVRKEPFTIIVDYAHTPTALEKVYQTIKKFQKQGKIIGVLGACGGGRDKWKRPVLGEIAVKYCQKVIITNEDPYDDDPLEIIEQVFEGTKGKAEKILDRREAIAKALRLAERGDVVIVTGKGSEPWMCVANGEKIPWDDRKIAEEEFSRFGLN